MVRVGTIDGRKSVVWIPPPETAVIKVGACRARERELESESSLVSVAPGLLFTTPSP